MRRTCVDSRIGRTAGCRGGVSIRFAPDNASGSSQEIHGRGAEINVLSHLHTSRPHGSPYPPRRRLVLGLDLIRTCLPSPCSLTPPPPSLRCALPSPRVSRRSYIRGLEYTHKRERQHSRQMRHPEYRLSFLYFESHFYVGGKLFIHAKNDPLCSLKKNTNIFSPTFDTH